MESLLLASLNNEIGQRELIVEIDAFQLKTCEVAKPWAKIVLGAVIALK